jgi:5-methylthioadenosine/S-adenosylhomocysteine deaminase
MTTRKNARSLFKGGIVITMDAAVHNLATGDVLVEGDRIVAVDANIQAAGAEVINASGSIVMPGLIDAHHHMWLGVVRRMMPNVDDLTAYFDLIGHKMGKQYRPIDMHLSIMLTGLASLDAGVTTSWTPAIFRLAQSIPTPRSTRWIRVASARSTWWVRR